VTLSVAQAPNGPLDIALRLPGWCAAPAIRLNGVPAAFERRAGYAVLRRSWRRGDRIELTLPMELRVEPTPDDPSVVAYLHGPLVLAADLGEASAPFEAQAPALVDAAPADAPIRVGSAGQQFRLRTRPADLPLVPFFRQHDRRTAVYFPVVTETRWGELEATFAVEQAARVELDARTVDRIRLGESASERAHGFRSNHSDLLSWGGRSGRQAWWGEGNYIAFDLAVRPGPMVLQALYWGEEVGKNFAILVDGREIAVERRGEVAVQRFVAKDYPLPSNLTEGKVSVAVRIETRGSDAPVYECRTLLVPQRTA